MAERLARAARTSGSLVHLGGGFVDQLGNIPRCHGAAFRQFAHFACDDREADAMLARAGRLDFGIEGQQIGLPGNLADDPDDLGNGGGGLLDQLDRFDRFAQRVLALFGVDLGLQGQAARLIGGIGDLVDRAGQAFGQSVHLRRPFGNRLFHQDLFGHVEGIFDDPVRLSLQVQDRIVGRLDPDIAVVLANPVEPSGMELSRIQLQPEIAVFHAADIVRRTEHRMVLPDDLAQGIADCPQEVVVCEQNLAIKIELDHRQAAANGIDLCRERAGAVLFLGDVAGDLYHLHRLSVGIEDGVVGCLDPDFLAILAQALVFAGIEFALGQLVPEQAVAFALHFRRIAEDAVMTPFDFGDGIAHQAQEIGIGGKDVARKVEFDDRLGAVDCADLAFVFSIDAALFRDVMGNLHDPPWSAGKVQDRAIGGADPDISSARAAALEYARDIFPLRQLLPERRIVVACRIDRIAQVLVRNLLLGPRFDSLHFQEQGIGRDDPPAQVEFHDRLRPLDRFDLAARGERFQALVGDVHRHLDDPLGLSIGIENRAVAGLEPDLSPILAQAGKFALLMPAFAQLLPELAVSGARAVGLGAEDPVVLSLQVRRFIAHDVQEVGIGADDIAQQVEFDHGKGGVDRLQNARRANRLGLLHVDCFMLHGLWDSLGTARRMVAAAGIAPDGRKASGRYRTLSGRLCAKPPRAPASVRLRTAGRGVGCYPKGHLFRPSI